MGRGQRTDRDRLTERWLRESLFFLAFGCDYIARAFHAAHAAAPRAWLLVNEYGVEYATPEHRARRGALLALVRSLVERNVPIHGVGIQAHLDLSKGSIDALGVRRFMTSLTSLGLSVSITELDVKARDHVLPAADRDRLVAEHVGAFSRDRVAG